MELKTLLADEFVLHAKTQAACMEAPYGMQGLLEEHAQRIARFLPRIAHRIRLLGDKPPMTIRERLSYKRLDDEPCRASELVHDHELLIGFVRADIELITDPGAELLLRDILQQHIEMACELRSYDVAVEELPVGI